MNPRWLVPAQYFFRCLSKCVSCCQWGDIVVLLHPLNAMELRSIKVKLQRINLPVARNGAHVTVSHLLYPVGLRSLGVTIDEVELCLRMLK